MNKQIFKIGRADVIKYYATSPSGKLITRYQEDDGFTSHRSVISKVVESLPDWYDEGMVYVHIVCESKGIAKDVGVRLPRFTYLK